MKHYREGDPQRQQEGYTLQRRSYRMRLEVLEGVETTAKRLHCSRAALVNDLIEAGLRYINSGDSLALNEMRSEYRMVFDR